jgi:hypothetical protein
MANRAWIAMQRFGVEPDRAKRVLPAQQAALL